MLCSPPTAANNRTLQCEVGNPLPAGTTVTARIFMQPTEANQVSCLFTFQLFVFFTIITSPNQDQPLSDYVFLLAANSSNPETPGEDQVRRDAAFQG